MILISTKAPGQLYSQLLKLVSENQTDRVSIVFENPFINCYDALAYHDILLMFKGQLDLYVEVHYNIPTNLLAAICALPVERRLYLPSVIVNFVRDTSYFEGTVTQVKISALQYQQVVGRLDAMISANTHIDIDEVKELIQIEGFLRGERLVEKGVFGGVVNV